MRFRILNHTVEIYISRNYFGRGYAGKILEHASYYQQFSDSPKIALIKTLRINQPDISLKDAKEAVETMYDFSTVPPTVK